MDLAAARIINSEKQAKVKLSDLIEIISPFSDGENFIGIVVHFDANHMHVYHSDIKKTIIWNRCVNCNVISV